MSDIDRELAQAKAGEDQAWADLAEAIDKFAVAMQERVDSLEEELKQTKKVMAEYER